MALAQVLLEFKESVAQCDSLIANAHKTDAAGTPVLPTLDQQQITVAAFLNMFIAWETFLELSLVQLMIGAHTISGTAPNRYVRPVDLNAARDLIVFVGRYFDYANHQNIIKVVRMYFEHGYPYEPHLSAIHSDLQDLRTMRNASAHVSSTTQTALESLTVRILGQPQPGIGLYQLLTMLDPRSGTGETIFSSYKNKLVVTAELISQG
jgi:hypothetical protein